MSSVGTFPWASIYSIIRNPKCFVFIGSFLLILFFSGIYSYFSYPGINTFEIARSFIALINGPLIFIMITKSSINESKKIAKAALKVLIFLTILGIIEKSNIFMEFYDLSKYLMPLASDVNLSNINRGVILLSSEPAKAGFNYFYLALIIRLIYIKSNRALLAYDFYVLFFILLLIQSVVTSFFLIIYLLCYRRFFTIMLIAVLILTLLLEFNILTSQTRAFEILKNTFLAGNISEIISIISNESGFRVVAILGSFLSPFYHLFGLGIGSWEFTSVNSLEVISQFITSDYFQNGLFPVRVNSYMGELFLSFGFLALPLIYYFYIQFIRNFLNRNGFTPSLFILFLLGLVYTESVGDPSPWIFFGLMLKLKFKLLPQGRPKLS